MAESYQDLPSETLHDLFQIQRSNLAHLERQAAQHGALHLPLPIANQIAATKATLTQIQAELSRRQDAGSPGRKAAYRAIFAQTQQVHLAIRQGADPAALQPLISELNTQILNQALDLDQADAVLVNRFIKAAGYLRSQLEQIGDGRALDQFSKTAPLVTLSSGANPQALKALRNASELYEQIVERFKAAGL